MEKIANLRTKSVMFAIAHTGHNVANRLHAGIKLCAFQNAQAEFVQYLQLPQCDAESGMTSIRFYMSTHQEVASTATVVRHT